MFLCPKDVTSNYVKKKPILSRGAFKDQTSFVHSKINSLENQRLENLSKNILKNHRIS